MNVRVLTIALLLLSAVCFAESIHLKGKAVLAQHLIERAWRHALEGRPESRPWRGADTWPVARLRNANLDRDLFVLSGAGGGTLAFGPGHFTHTAMPGDPGASVIAGHRDTHFRFIEKLEPDDEIHVQKKNGDWVLYRVRELVIVDTRSARVWATPAARDELHLITCYPFDAVAAGGPLRMVVIAEQR